MSNQTSELPNIQYAQRERLAFIDYCLEYVGKVSRTTLVAHFDVGVASCSRDFKLYSSLAPNNVTFTHRDKFYYRTEEFTPLFNHEPSVVLKSLSEGFGDGFANPRVQIDWIFDAPTLVLPKPELVGTITRTIASRSAITICYHSLSSGESERTIVPHAIVNNGQRWHVRAFDLQSQSFRDFVCTRIEHVSSSEHLIDEAQTASADGQWQKKLSLELVPHPKLKHRKSIELDFGMQEGKRVVETRAALAGYLLRYWNVDCSDDADLPSEQNHLWLKNSQIKSVIENISLAPGAVGCFANTVSMEQ